MTRYFNDTNNILSKAEVKEFPFPHASALSCFPWEIYSELALTRPDWEVIAGKHRDASNKRVDLQAWQALKTTPPPLWKEFIEYHTSHSFYLKVLEKFGSSIKEFYPHLDFEKFKTVIRGEGEADIYMDCQIGINTPVRQKGTVSKPHLDNPQELWACLFYMPLDGDDAGGDLVMYKCRDIPKMYDKRQIMEEELIEYQTFPYEKNSMICFVNTPYSIHSVTDRGVTDKPRLLVNISIEMDKGLFNLDRMYG